MVSSAEIDIELAQRPTVPSLVEGYPTVARFIARDPDAHIYRSFSHLASRRLLYLQSELGEIDAQLERLDRSDAESFNNVAARKAAASWAHYVKSDDARVKEHRKLQEQIRYLLREYHETLVLQSKVLALQKPTSRTLRAFSQWFTQNDVPKLGGQEASYLERKDDLVALAPVEQDRLNLIMQDYFGWFFRKRRHEFDRPENIYYFPARRIRRAGAVISVLLSATLLVGAIVCLLLVADRGWHVRVGFIVLFTALFAVVVGLLTNARRAEIFGSTAAYAAVLVVFVSGNLTGTPQQGS